jgi:stearoyl-CoA desaturase (delta-9 desaturase)
MTGGESLHNNHHAHPRSPRFSVRRSEFDPSWLVIRALAAVKLVAIVGVLGVPQPAGEAALGWRNAGGPGSRGDT